MPSSKPGKKRYQTMFQEDSVAHKALIQYAQQRDIQPGLALRLIANDFFDAMNGRVNFLALAMATTAGVNLSGLPLSTTSSPGPAVMSPEELARQKAQEEANDQFLM